MVMHKREINNIPKDTARFALSIIQTRKLKQFRLLLYVGLLFLQRELKHFIYISNKIDFQLTQNLRRNVG